MALVGKLISRYRFDGGGQGGDPIFNVGVSNVPGPQQPLYMMGCELKHFSVVAPITDGLGITFGVCSYNGNLEIFPTSCRDIMPDPEFMGECLLRAMREINEAISKLPTKTLKKRKKTAAKPVGSKKPAIRRRSAESSTSASS